MASSYKARIKKTSRYMCIYSHGLPRSISRHPSRSGGGSSMAGGSLYSISDCSLSRRLCIHRAYEPIIKEELFPLIRHPRPHRRPFLLVIPSLYRILGLLPASKHHAHRSETPSSCSRRHVYRIYSLLYI